MDEKQLLEIGNEINDVAATIVQLVQAHKDNWNRLDLLVTNECMRLQNIAKKCGIVYIADEDDDWDDEEELDEDGNPIWIG